MKSRVALQAGLLALVVTAAACGPNVSNPPTGPSGPASLSALLQPRLDGLWGGPLTLVGVAGGTGPARNAGALECVAAAFNAVVGEANDHSLLITQSGTKLSARLVSAGTGLACTYDDIPVPSGTAFTFAAAKCEAPTLILRCPPTPSGVVPVREMQLVGSSLTATFDGPVDVTTIRGTAAHTYNLTGPLDSDNGTLVANHTFTSLTRR